MESVNPNNSEKKPTTTKKKAETGKKLDEKQANIIFFAILVIGLIIFIVLFLLTPTTAKYEAYFGEIKAEIVLSEKTADMIVYIEDEKFEQEGQVAILEEGDNYILYEVTFEDEVVIMYATEDNLTLTYDSGEEIEFTGV